MAYIILFGDHQKIRETLQSTRIYGKLYEDEIEASEFKSKCDELQKAGFYGVELKCVSKQGRWEAVTFISRMRGSSLFSGTLKEVLMWSVSWYKDWPDCRQVRLSLVNTTDKDADVAQAFMDFLTMGEEE